MFDLFFSTLTFPPEDKVHLNLCGGHVSLQLQKVVKKEKDTIICFIYTFFILTGGSYTLIKGASAFILTLTFTDVTRCVSGEYKTRIYI